MHEINDSTRIPLRWFIAVAVASLTSLATTVGLGIIVGSYTARTDHALASQAKDISSIQADREKRIEQDEKIATALAEIKTTLKILLEDRRR